MRRQPGINRQEEKDAYLLLLPLVVLMLVFTVYPVLANFYYSLTEWKGFGHAQWVGLENYRHMLEDEKFLYSLKNLGVLILYIPVGLFTPLLIASVLREGLKGWKIFRAVIYLPTVLGYVILGTLFSIILAQSGPLSSLLSSLGFENAEELNLLGQSRTAIHTLAVLFVVFSKMGFGCIYFLAAMSSIDVSLYDAAGIDGANWWQKFFHITVPSISYSVQFFFVLSFIEVLARMYSFIFTMTYGGPGFATYTLEFGVYRQGFQAFKMGYASSWAVALFFLCSLVAWMQIRLLKNRSN